MSKSDIINFPQPEQWTAKQCEEWCNSNGIDFRSDCQEYDHCILTLWLADVIEFGESEISDDVLRRILLLRLDDTDCHGLTLWRRIVKSNAPEIYEWWAIEESLADDLVEMGSLVLKNKYGCWWGRQGTGMEILMGGTLQAVARKRRYGPPGGEDGRNQEAEAGMLNARSHNDLPHYWRWPVPDLQATLFRHPTDEVLVNLQVSRDDLRRWQRAGWISFDIENYHELDEPLISEIEFVLTLARSGLSDAQINKLLEGLSKPFRFQPAKVAFHFSYGWVEPVQDDSFDIIEKNIDDWLNDLLSNEDAAALKSLAEKIADHLTVLEADLTDSEEAEVEDSKDQS